VRAHSTLPRPFYERLRVPELSTARSLRAAGTPGISYRAWTCRQLRMERHRKHTEGRPIGQSARIPDGVAFSEHSSGLAIASRRMLEREDRTRELSRLTASISRPARVQMAKEDCSSRRRDLLMKLQLRWSVLEFRWTPFRENCALFSTLSLRIQPLSSDSAFNAWLFCEDSDQRRLDKLARMYY